MEVIYRCLLLAVNSLHLLCYCLFMLCFHIFLFAGVPLSYNAFDLPGLLYNMLMFPSILQALHKILVLFFDIKVTLIRRAATVTVSLYVAAL